MRFCYEWEKGGMTMGLSQKDGAPDKGPALFQGPPPRFRIDIDGSLLRARLRHLRRAGPFDCPQPSRRAGTQKAAPEGNGFSYSASGAFIFYK